MVVRGIMYEIDKDAFKALRLHITPKEVDHESKKLIEEIIDNLKTDKTLSNRLINAGISSLQRLYKIAIITKIDDKTGRIEIVEWFKERRSGEREDKKKKSFKDIIII